jgi:hypothetical protein
MNHQQLDKPWIKLCTTVLAAGGLSLATLGLASGTAQAAPPPAPMDHHHWCPGDRWDPGWGNNPDWGRCRDWDDNFGARWAPPPPFAPPAPPPPPWAPWASVVWNPDVNAWGFWNNGIWVGI